jgi:hypothetical protein
VRNPARYAFESPLSLEQIVARLAAIPAAAGIEVRATAAGFEIDLPDPTPDRRTALLNEILPRVGALGVRPA